jgi:hypothetical protein
MPRKLHGIDFIQTTEPDLLFRDVSLYTEPSPPRRRRRPSFTRQSPPLMQAVVSPTSRFRKM